MPMRVINQLLLLVVMALLASCASAPPSGAAPFQDAPPAPEGYGTLYIYRPYDDVGKLPGPRVYINGLEVAGLANGSYSVVYLRPGRYAVGTRPGGSGAARGLTADIEISDVGEHFLLFDRAYGRRNVLDPVSFALAPAQDKLYERWTVQTRDQAIFSINRCYLLPAKIDRLE
jgi:hypothetical protein